MQSYSECSISSKDLYEITNEDNTINLSNQSLTEIPDIVNCRKITTLYLQNNAIDRIRDDFFESLPCLMWLDLRDNKIAEIPKNIRGHPNLAHLLLQNNLITTLPNEIGSLENLKTLKISGNPITYPPQDITNLGSKVIIQYLKTKLAEEECSVSTDNSGSKNIEKKNDKKEKKISVQMSGKGNEHRGFYCKHTGKCPKLSRTRAPRFGNSRKYLKPLRPAALDDHTESVRRAFFREAARNEAKLMAERREKILQGRKNIEALKSWRQNYREQIFNSDYKFDPTNIPFDVDPDHMVFLSREDIVGDLPDKYKKNLTTRSKFTVPRRRNDDEILAGKIKQLFANIEKIDLNRDSFTPRTEQNMLMNEINKITEIKRKLKELSYMSFKNTID